MRDTIHREAAKIAKNSINIVCLCDLRAFAVSEFFVPSWFKSPLRVSVSPW